MTERTYTRRSVVTAAGASLVAATVPSALASEDESAASDWEIVETPIDSTLHDVVYTREGPYAVGEGGTILERTAEGWRTVLRGGPTGNGNDLYGAAVTDDGRRLWFAGASGAIGEYDVVAGTLDDHSAPNDSTNNFNDIAVTGEAGAADVYVAGDSGAIHYSFANGATGTWEYSVPGSGSGLPAVEFHGSRAGHAIDTNGRVFATDDGVTWEPIGIPDAGVTFYGLDADAPDDVTVSGGNGSIFQWDGSQWTPTSVGDAGLRDVETGDGADLAVGGGGKIFERDGRWRQLQTPAGENLQAVAVGPTDIAVGASAVVLERRDGQDVA